MGSKEGILNLHMSSHSIKMNLGTQLCLSLPQGGVPISPPQVKVLLVENAFHASAGSHSSTSWCSRPSRSRSSTSDPHPRAAACTPPAQERSKFRVLSTISTRCVLFCAIIALRKALVKHHKLGTVWFLRRATSGTHFLLCMTKNKLRDITLFWPQRCLYRNAAYFFSNGFRHHLCYIWNNHGSRVSFRFSLLFPY